MSLSCSCDDSDGDGWWYEGPTDYLRLDTKRSRKCCSCKARIAVGELAIKFRRWRTPDEESVAYRIHGDEEGLASWWMCEACADQYFNLTELGFCIIHGSQSMDSLRREYVEMNAAAAIRARSKT